MNNNNDNSIMLDSDFSDELVINEEVEEFKRMSYTSSEEEEEEEDYIYYKPTAPPPSPQEPSMLDMIFKEDNKSVYKERELMEHAQTLDKLLRRTLQQNKHPKLKNIMKAAASDKLKKRFIIDEETSLMIHELREMGL